MASLALHNVQNQIAAPSPRKSAEIVRFWDRDRAWAKLRDLAPDTITDAFHAQSLNAICENAAKELGTSDDTIYRIIDGQTTKPDLTILLGACWHYRKKLKRRAPIADLVLQLMGEL